MSLNVVIENMIPDYQLVIDLEPTDAILHHVKQQIVSFNNHHFEVTERNPIAIIAYSDGEFTFGKSNVDFEKIAGAITGVIFGRWLMIDYLYVAESHRGNRLGNTLLSKLEEVAMENGCEMAQLDTLEFQAKPFYEKQGYKVKMKMEGYPQTGTRYFMQKVLL